MRHIPTALGLIGLVWLVGTFPELTAQQTTTRQGAKALYAVTHVDFAATSADLVEATRLMREFGVDSQKDPGVIRFEIVVMEGHPNHFTIYEVWQSREAFDAHLAAPHTRQFREKIQPMLGSPFRERLHTLQQ
jgi:quinol monooxygenase YgiN